MGIESCIKSDTPSVFRRLYMKRRTTTGDYESDWQLIPDSYILDWGSVQYGIDDIKANYFDYSGFDFTLQNTDGKFSDQYDDKSFWYGYLTRYRTMVRVDAGYIDTAGNEYPASPTVFVGILNEDMPYKNDMTIQFKSDHLSKVFEEFPADRLLNMVATTTGYTAYQIIVNKTYWHSDGSSNQIFKKYINTWIIEGTTNKYYIDTGTALQGNSVWDLFKKLAESENKLLYVSGDGILYFRTKTASATVSYHFSGINDPDNTYGRNILETVELSENISQIFNRVKVKYGKDNTITSYYILNETWTWGDSSSSFMYGVKEYEYENEWLDAATAATVANTIYTEFKWPKQLLKMTTKFVPQIIVNNTVTVTYKTYLYSGESLWGWFMWGSGFWGTKSGKNINLDNQSFQVWNLSHNLNDFTTEITLRSIT